MLTFWISEQNFTEIHRKLLNIVIYFICSNKTKKSSGGGDAVGVLSCVYLLQEKLWLLNVRSSSGESLLTCELNLSWQTLQETCFLLTVGGARAVWRRTAFRTGSIWGDGETHRERLIKAALEPTRKSASLLRHSPWAVKRKQATWSFFYKARRLSLASKGDRGSDVNTDYQELIPHLLTGGIEHQSFNTRTLL